MPYPEFNNDLEVCRSIHKRYGKSFYIGTLLLAREERDATCILYAFFRFPDEYVDTYYADKKETARALLTQWNERWQKAYNGEPLAVEANDKKSSVEERIVRAAAYVFKTYNIPYEYSQAFLSAMIQDTEKERYATYAELEAYMYGSAAVVGLMMTYILCSADKHFIEDKQYRNEILDKARALGEAFQMTNFLRDVGEDITLRGRIYLPIEDMQRYDVTEKDIREGMVTPNFISLMQYEIERTQLLYKEADKGVAMLPPRARKGIYTARVIYSKIILKIEAANYNVFSSRLHLTFIEKIGASLPAIIK